MQQNYNKRIYTSSNDSFRKKTFISFVVFFFLLAGGVFAWKWLLHQPKIDGAYAPLRKTLSANESVFNSAFSDNRLTKTYKPEDAVKRVRVNGDYGLKDSISEQNWNLNIVRSNGDTLKISLDEIKKLPKKDIVFDFKCIEGWSQVTHWGGVSLKTFLEHYKLDEEETYKYVGMQTPDKKYYVGIDMKSALHPQTILCYEMNGKPLPLNQGYPLRLIIPVKYGVKHLKRIGDLFFSNSKPKDYWAERGYDYYAGL